ncbi:hypothetical protein OUZ56_026701 [Daphnia magna]|uniref:Uncharacterized protein n=1 Tax=Daphnia magna TaxID=35525 RepID=A0ABQ9ZMI4_9CRUS|nr:hypothetical protein OUZ56_026701 [Daphnia magna]
MENPSCRETNDIRKATQRSVQKVIQCFAQPTRSKRHEQETKKWGFHVNSSKFIVYVTTNHLIDQRSNIAREREKVCRMYLTFSRMLDRAEYQPSESICFYLKQRRKKYNDDNMRKLRG